MRVVNAEDLWELGGIFQLDLFAQYLSQAALHTSMKSGSRCEHPRGDPRLLDRSTDASGGPPFPLACNPEVSLAKVIAQTYHRTNLACNARDLRSAITSPATPHRCALAQAPLGTRASDPPLTAHQRPAR